MISVKTEIIHGDDIDKNIKNDYQRTLKAVERAKPTEINKNVDLDIIAKIVERRLLDSKTINKSSGKEKKTSFLNYFLALISIFFLLGLFYSIYHQEKERRFKEKVTNDILKRDRDEANSSKDAFVGGSGAFALISV